MTTMIFVHGISIRAASYKVALGQIEDALKRDPNRPEVTLAPCLWGEQFGAVLKAGGAAIPWYNTTKGIEEIEQVNDELARWQALDVDPLCELRLLALRPAVVEPFDPLGRKTPSQVLDERIQTLAPSAPLAESLNRAGIETQEFTHAYRTITGSPIYQEALNASTDDLGEFRFALARAIVAQVMALCGSSDDSAPILFDTDLRDDLVDQLANEWGGQPKGLVRDWLKQAVSAFGTRYLLSWRGHYSDVVVPYIGDILLYQGHGQPIREFIRTCIEEAEPPVVLLGHSLGGIACVDLLVEEPLEKVRLLVTVGSQSPLFYEMDALQSLRYGQPLPEHFPKKWLNIFDRRDFLSYLGAQVFPDSLQRIEDIEVNNRRPFPQSHGAYWANDQTWKAVIPRLP